MALAVSALKYNYVSIQNPKSEKPAIDLTNHLVQTEYFEDLLSPVITMTLRIRSEFVLNDLLSQLQVSQI